MTMRLLILIPLAFATSLPFAIPSASAQAPAVLPVAEPAEERITLQQALARAAAGNPELRRTRARVDGAKGLLTAARGIYDLELEAAGRFSRRVTPRVGADDLTGGALNLTSYRLGLARRLETGGRLALGLDGTAAESDSRFECGVLVEPGQACRLHTVGASLSLVQPLLEDFGPAVANAEIRRRAVEGDITSATRLASAAVVVRDVVVAYWQLAYSHAVLAIQRSALALAHEQRRATQKQVEVGKMAPLEAAAAEQAVSGTELLVLSAEEEVFSRTVELRELYGADNPIPVTVLLTRDQPTAEVARPDPAALVERALAGNPHLRALRTGRQLSDVELTLARSMLLPRLDLEAQVGTAGRSQESRQAFQQTRLLDNTAWFVGLTFALPLPNRAARGRMEHARAQRTEVEIDVEALEREIRNQVIRLANALASGQRRLELAKKTISFAEMNLKAERARFGLGQATNNDVLRVQQDLKQAQLTEAAAALELVSNQAALEALTGDILDRHGVVLAEREGR